MLPLGASIATVAPRRWLGTTYGCAPYRVAYVNQALSTGWLYGTTPQGGLSPTVQAYRLPKDASNELKFCTGVKPASGGGPIQSWYQGMPGVINHDDVTVKIPIVPIQ